MADVTDYTLLGHIGNFVTIRFTKTGATDTITIPAVYGKKVLWCDVLKESTQVKDPATAVSTRTVTLSTGTGDMIGVFFMSDQ